MLEAANVRLQAILENDAELDAGALRRFDERIGALGADIDGLFGEDMQAAASGRNAMSGVQAGRTSDDDQIHRAMREEGIEVLIGLSAVLAAEASDFFRVGAVDGGNFDAGNGACGAGVRLRDISAANETNVRGHRASMGQR